MQKVVLFSVEMQKFGLKRRALVGILSMYVKMHTMQIYDEVLKRVE